MDSEDNSISKHLTWEDINSNAKKAYYKFLEEHRSEIVNGTVSRADFAKIIPAVSVEISFDVEASELYYVKDIAFAVANNSIQYGLFYYFGVETPSKLLEIIKEILADESVVIDVAKRNLLPINMYTFKSKVVYYSRQYKTERSPKDCVLFCGSRIQDFHLVAFDYPTRRTAFSLASVKRQNLHIIYIQHFCIICFTKSQLRSPACVLPNNARIVFLLAGKNIIVIR